MLASSVLAGEPGPSSGLPAPAAASALSDAGEAPAPSAEPGPGPDVPSALDTQPPTSVEQELAQIRPGVAIKREFDRFAERTNLRFGVAHTMLFQQASAGPGSRSAAGGDLDLLARWTALGAGTPDTGALVFAGEFRYQIGSQPPAALGGQIGTLLATTNGFGERPMSVKELYWDQRLFNDGLRVVIGRVDPDNLFGGHRLQSANTSFLNRAFSTNPTVAYPGSGLGVAAQVKPVSWFSLAAGLADANGKTTVGNFEGFFEDAEFLTFAEAAFTPVIDGLGSGRYRLAVWSIDARDDAQQPSDRGFSIIVDQDLGESLIAFARYGHSDADVTNVTDSLQIGLGVKNLLGAESLLGIAAAWSAPNNDLREEKVVEVFQRVQITETTQFTVGLQAIIDPSNAPDDDALAVFSARLRIAF